MAETTNIAKSTGLSNEVKLLLEVPPKWMVRNGGFLLITYIGIIYTLLNIIQVPQTYVGQATFNPVSQKAAPTDDLQGTMVVPQKIATMLRQKYKIKLTNKVDGNQAAGYAYIISVVNKGNKAILHFGLPEQEGKSLFAQLKTLQKKQLALEMGQTSILSGIMDRNNF